MVIVDRTNSIYLEVLKPLLIELKLVLAPMFRKLVFGLVLACEGDVADEEAAGAEAQAAGDTDICVLVAEAEASGGPSDPRVLMVRAPRAPVPIPAEGPKPMLPTACSSGGTGEPVRSCKLEGTTGPPRPIEVLFPSCAAAKPEPEGRAAPADAAKAALPEVEGSAGSGAVAPARMFEGPE